MGSAACSAHRTRRPHCLLRRQICHHSSPGNAPISHLCCRRVSRSKRCQLAAGFCTTPRSCHIRHPHRPRTLHYLLSHLRHPLRRHRKNHHHRCRQPPMHFIIRRRRSHLCRSEVTRRHLHSRGRPTAFRALHRRFRRCLPFPREPLVGISRRPSKSASAGNHRRRHHRFPQYPSQPTGRRHRCHLLRTKASGRRLPYPPCLLAHTPPRLLSPLRLRSRPSGRAPS